MSEKERRITIYATPVSQRHHATPNVMCDNPECVDCKGWRAYHRQEAAMNSLQRHTAKCFDCQTRPVGSYCWVGRKIADRLTGSSS